MSLTNILLIVIIILLVLNLLLLLFQFLATFTIPERLMEFLLDTAEAVMDTAGDQFVEVEVTPVEVEETEQPKTEQPKKGGRQSKTTSRSRRSKSAKARQWKKVTKEEAE